MRKFIAFIACGCLAVNLAGCAAIQPKQSPPPAKPSVSATEDTPTFKDSIVPMHAIILPPAKETVTADDGTALFSLQFQQAQVVLHDQSMEEKIIGSLQTRIGPVLENAYEIEAQAQLDYPNSEYWSEYFIDISYTPTRLDRSVLSLFANISSYSGGPHPSLVTDSVTFDLQTGDIVCLDDILAPECTSDQLYQLILRNLEPQADALYYDYADALGDRFTGELHNIQDWYFSRSGLCFHFAPYDIAPYSSGTIIAELPYSTLNGILNEKYLPEEAAVATGSMYAQTYIVDDKDRFTFVADVALCENGNEILLYPDATVTDLRIESGFFYPDSNQYIAGATIFAANTVNMGDAIHLTADLNNNDTILRLVYQSGRQKYSAFITYDDASNSILLTNG